MFKNFMDHSSSKRLSIDACFISNPLLKTFVNKMIRSRTVKVNINVEPNNCKICGSLKQFKLSDELKSKLRKKLNIQEEAEVGCVSKALRIVHRDEIFFSKEYSRMRKRVAHTVLVRDVDVAIGQIEYFLYHLASKTCFAVINKLDMCEEPLLHPLVSHLIRLKKHQEINIFIVPVDEIIEKVLYLDGNKEFPCICKLPNLYGQCS